MTILLPALSLENYRGIGPETQYMIDFQQLNFFIGANNSGKSIILNYISKYIDSDETKNIKELDFDSVERFRGERGESAKAQIGMPLSVLTHKLNNADINWQSTGIDVLSLILEVVHNSTELEQIWVQNIPGNDGYVASNLQGDLVQWSNYERNWRLIMQTFYPNFTGGDLDMWRKEALRSISKFATFNPPHSSLIPAKRQLGPKGEAYDDLSGKGLIDQLAEIQSPDHHERDKYLIFNKINQFVSTVIGKQDAKIEVPHDRKHLIVHIDDKVLPLSSLGTGIHEVILIAAFCTLKENQIVCIEEPEIHLHPTLQRKLIEYLRHNTSNQYFIATHSAALIDTENAAVFRVANDGYQSRISKMELKQDHRDLCTELGYRASDIVQANCVIWVEGPSDRIYLNKWIRSKKPDLKEGTDYSIMFYGGRLLSHLSSEDEDENARSVGDLIDLQSLNKNTVVMIDSDKASTDDEINSTKQRIHDELDRNSGLSWISAGREIENYVPYNELQEAVKSNYPNLYLNKDKGGAFDHALYFKQNTEKSKASKPKTVYTNVDKVAVAKLVCENDVDWSVLDLEERISELISFIEKANK